MDHFAPSLLDKLLVDAADTGSGRAATLRFSAEQVKDSVARDIETLLNTRPGHDPAALADYPEAARSLLTFGLTDITALSLASDGDRARIVASIGQSLADHEPRLTDVTVSVQEAHRPGEGLRFSIRARLQLNPEVEPVAFDAVLQPGSNRYAVARTPPRALAGR